MGPLRGGALELADGRRFEKKRKWHQYNGAEVEHRVQPFRGERLTVVLFSEPEKCAIDTSDSPGDEAPQGERERAAPAPQAICCDCVEPLLGVKKSYRNVGRKERQEELFPTLQKEIATKRAELYKGVRWPDQKARWSQDYHRGMKEAVKGKIGGSSEEQDKFFAEVIAAHPEQFWLEGCTAPCVRGTVISFKLKPGAKPVARQPIPMSPYDEL